MTDDQANCRECRNREHGYNGSKNYETWVVGLWIDNEQGTYYYAQELVADLAENAKEASQVSSGIWTVDQAQRFAVADGLKEWVLDEILPDLGATLAADLLGAAVSEVDWYEIADNYLAEYRDSLKEAEQA